jgi:hypothetical protein
LIRGHQQERDGDRDDPTGDQQLPPTEAIGQCSGEVIGDRFHDTEYDDKGKHRAGGC